MAISSTAFQQVGRLVENTLLQLSLVDWQTANRSADYSINTKFKG